MENKEQFNEMQIKNKDSNDAIMHIDEKNYIPNIQTNNDKNNKLNNDSDILINKNTDFSVNDNTNIETKQNDIKKETQLIFQGPQQKKEKKSNVEEEPIIKIDQNQKYYISCIYCNKSIYIKRKEISKLNSLNIKCGCKQYFYISICPKCKKPHIIRKFVSEGDLIKCETCLFVYLESLCPIKSCPELFYFPKPKSFSNSPNGIIHTHEEKIIFQNISCYYCKRTISFITEGEKNINRYFEAMRVQCPYQDCGRCFNRIICPKCCEIIFIESGLYIMGSRIKCHACHIEFAKILCPLCLRINPLTKNVFKYGEIQCRHSSCSQISSIANCLHCQRMNYFKYNKKKPLILAQPIECGYEDCRKKFCVAFCPACDEINPFPNADFAFGKIYKCKNYAKCGKNFMILVCGNCKSCSRLISECEGKKYTCNVCKTPLANFQCPFCKVSILDTNILCNFGQMVECPSCKKHFSFFRCSNCKRLINSKENECILGKSVTCDFCQSISVNIICPNRKCYSKISLIGQETEMEIDKKIECPNCIQKFKFGEKLGEDFEKLHSDNLTYIPILKGIPVNFGKPSKNENQLERAKIFEDVNEEKNAVINNNNNNNQRQDNNLCIICQSKNKESVFFPCGHRCSCYQCAIYYYEVYKKCPRCKENSKCIIPRIYYT